MRYVNLATAALCLAVLPVGATPQNDAAVFQNTVRNVDMNGTYLDYINTTSVIKMVYSLPDRAEMLLGRSSEPQARQAINVIRILLKALNLSAWKASAVSCRTVSEGVHLTRAFAYLGQDINAPGLAALPGKKNIAWKRLKKLPMDTRIALGGDLQLGKFWQDISRSCTEGSDPLLAMTVQQLPQLFEMQTQVRFPELLASISGPYELLIFGGVGNPGGLLIVPDQKGLLGNWLRQLLALPAHQVEVPLPIGEGLHPAFSPVIRFEKGYLVIFSSASAAKRLANVPPGGLLATAKFAPYFKLMPKTGLGYCIVNMDEVLRNELLAMAPPAERPRVARALGGIELNLVSMTERTSDGFALRAVTNTSLPEIMAAVSIISFTGSMMPVLDTAMTVQAKHDQACPAQMKQLGLGCIIYANDHDGALPKTPAELVKAKAVEEKMLRCPVSQGKLPYVFLGGLNLKKWNKPAATPIAFDAPGAHGDTVHVLFADGHVEKIRVPDYRSVEQVIGVLNRTYRYTPEELQNLRSALQVK